MTRESLDTIVTSTFDTLVAQLEAGQTDVLRQHLEVAARFHRYSWRNQLLIASQCPTATRVAGFHTWRHLRRWVRKGEHGIVIIAPIVHGGRARDVEPAAEETDSRVAGYRAAYVFDVAQTEGEELPQLRADASGDPGAWLLTLEQAVRDAGVTLVDAMDLGGADAVSTPGHIEVLATLSAPDRFCAIVHEAAHEFLHQRGDRPGSKTVRETEAEAVAFIVGSAVGVTSSVSARDYIGLYSGNADTLRASLTRIQQTARTILASLNL